MDKDDRVRFFADGVTRLTLAGYISAWPHAVEEVRMRFKTIKHLGLIALFILPLGGCGYVTRMTADDVMPQYDTSTGPDTAVIGSAARHPFGAGCRIVRDSGRYHEVVVDAGTAMLQVECSRDTGIFGETTEQLGRANLAFHAEAGRNYHIEFSEEFGFPHVAVRVAEHGSPVIHRRLLGPRVAADVAAAHATLVARSGRGVISCSFGRPWDDRRVSSIRRPARSFVHEPYSHQIVAECSTHAYVTGYVKERYQAPVDFVPKSGRLYTVHMDTEDPSYVFVTDVSSEARTIAHFKAVRTN